MTFVPFVRASPAQQKQAVANTRKAAPKAFPTHAAASIFLFQLIFPPSRRWCFVSVGKSGSTSTLQALYEAEFGHPLTADALPLHDINPDAAVHSLPDHGIFARALWQGRSIQDVLADPAMTVRTCVVRHPLARAISAFRYLCQSHRLRSRWFASERFLMDARAGFDWNRHPDTTEGFCRFLRFIAWQQQELGSAAINGHWRAQVDFIQPAVYRPTLIGRMEEMDGYFAALGDRLGQRLQPRWQNRQETGGGREGLDTPEAVALCETVFAADYEVFEYARS